MVVEKVRKNCIGKYGENKYEELGFIIEEIVIKFRLCLYETGIFRCNIIKFFSWCLIMYVILVRLIF